MIEWIDPDELRGDETPEDAAHTQEWVLHIASGEPFPGRLSPEAIFSDMVVVTTEEAALIEKHCRERGYHARIGWHPRLGQVFYRLDYPSPIGQETCDGIERTKLMEEVKAFIVHSLRNESRVYFIEAVGLGCVKIGCAENVRDRLEQISTACPVPLRILASIPGGYEVERDLHNRFSECRTRGEWFGLTNELQQFITSVME